MHTLFVVIVRLNKIFKKKDQQTVSIFKSILQSDLTIFQKAHKAMQLESAKVKWLMETGFFFRACRSTSE